MSMSDLFSQIDFLRRQEFGGTESMLDEEQIELLLRNTNTNSGSNGALPKGLLASVTLSLTYALYRHRHWIHTPIFRDILISHIRTDFRIDTSAAVTLTETLLRCARSRQILKPSHVDNSDVEFLRYIFVTAATAEDEKTLIRDMGLGAEIIHKMKSTLKLLKNDPDAAEANSQMFLSELDAQIFEIMLDVSRDIRKYAWAIHVDKLRYMIMGVEDPLSDLITTFGARWIFETLLAIGSRSICSSNQIVSRLHKTFIASEASMSDKTAEHVLRQFYDLKLIFPSDGARSNLAKFKWELTEDAARLTADAFALTHLNAQKNPFATFRDLNYFYQRALLTHMDVSHTEGVVALLKKSPSLHGDVIKAAVQFLSKYSQSESFAHVIEDVKSTHENQYFQRSLSRALTTLGL